MSFQTTIITGHVGGEVTQVSLENSKVANFSIAVNEQFGNSTKTTWFQVSAWDALADVATKHISKGRHVLIEGRVSGNAWMGKDGSVQFALSLSAQKIRLLDSKSSGEE